MDIEINKRVTKYRKKNGMKQYQVAEMLGMKLSSYSQMERLGDISAERIRKLAEIFNMDVRNLLYDENFPNPGPAPVYNPEKFILLPALTNGMSYMPVHNIESALITIYRNEFKKENQKQICELFDYLRKNKHTKIDIEKIKTAKI